MKEALIVLGGGINEDGSLREPSKARVELAVKLYQNGEAGNIIFTSKYSKNIDFVPPLTIAAAMKKLAEELGVPEKHIFIEEESSDTIGNFFFTTKNILLLNEWESIVIVTSEFQLDRAKYLAEKIFPPRFEVEFKTVQGDIPAERMPDQMVSEQKLIDFSKRLFDSVPNGDLDKIEEILFSQHPGYTEGLEYKGGDTQWHHRDSNTPYDADDAAKQNPEPKKKNEDEKTESRPEPETPTLSF